MKIKWLQAMPTIFLGAAILTLNGTVMAAGTKTVTPSIPKMKMTTEIPDSITMPDKIETRIGTLELFDGFPSDETANKAYDFLLFQRGVDVFLDEMRAASMVALRNGHRELGVTEGHKIALFGDLMDSKAIWLTPKSETVYASTFLDLSANVPMVIESPPNVLCILDDMWMRYVGDIGNAGPDKGKGGKFIILPPGFEGQIPDGYHVFHWKTHGVWFLLRGFLVDGETGPAVASFEKHLKIYPFSKAGNRPAMEFKNVSGKVHNTIHANDIKFFHELDSLIQEEHANAISPEARGSLAMPGIGSQYAAACRDAEGAYLDGSKTYKLTLPANIPAKDFWSIVLYDSQTRSMLQTDQQFPSLNSQRGSVEQNTGGSFDIYFGPEPSEGKDNNWIQTIPGKAFWLLFRLYGPREPWFEKTWRPGKIEMVQ
jgi:hypothetical protein